MFFWHILVVFVKNGKNRKIRSWKRDTKYQAESDKNGKNEIKNCIPGTMKFPKKVANSKIQKPEKTEIFGRDRFLIC